MSEEVIESYCSQFPQKSFKAIPGTRNMYQLINVPSFEDGVFIINFSCACSQCLQSDYTQCIFVRPSDLIFTENFNIILPKLYDFHEKEQGDGDQRWYSFVKTGNDYPYYLVKLICDPFTTKSETKNDYNHTYPPEDKTVIGNYLEIHKDTKDRKIYYLENKRKAIIPFFSIVGVSPELEFIQGKRCGKTDDMYLVTHDVLEAICNFTLMRILVFEYLNHFKPMFHLWKIQVDGFY